jgi:hypothetical protein
VMQDERAQWPPADLARLLSMPVAAAVSGRQARCMPHRAWWAIARLSRS